MAFKPSASVYQMIGGFGRIQVAYGWSGRRADGTEITSTGCQIVVKVAGPQSIPAERYGKCTNLETSWGRAEENSLEITKAGTYEVTVRVRSSMMELVDGVTSDHYKRLDRWMSVEHEVINGLLEQTMLNLSGSGHTLKQIEDAHHPPNEWAATFINNLRVARKLEPSPEVETSIEEMIAAGEKALSQLPQRNLPRPDGGPATRSMRPQSR